MLMHMSLLETSVVSQSLMAKDEFKKIAILKKGIGIESHNLCKQFNDQKTIETRWNPIVWLL